MRLRSCWNGEHGGGVSEHVARADAATRAPCVCAILANAPACSVASRWSMSRHDHLVSTSLCDAPSVSARSPPLTTSPANALRKSPEVDSATAIARSTARWLGLSW